MFRTIHTLYTDAVCNPFYIPGEALTSKYVSRISSTQPHYLHSYLFIFQSQRIRSSSAQRDNWRKQCDVNVIVKSNCFYHFRSADRYTSTQ